MTQRLTGRALVLLEKRASSYCLFNKPQTVSIIALRHEICEKNIYIFGHVVFPFVIAQHDMSVYHEPRPRLGAAQCAVASTGMLEQHWYVRFDLYQQRQYVSVPGGSRHYNVELDLSLSLVCWLVVVDDLQAKLSSARVRDLADIYAMTALSSISRVFPVMRVSPPLTYADNHPQMYMSMS